MGIVSTDTKEFDKFIKKRQMQLRRTRSTEIFQPVLRDKQIPGMEIQEVNIGTYRYYYLSSQEGLKKLTPIIPDLKGLDHKTPRISFYTSINQAILALGGNQRGKEYYVYTPKSYDHHSAVKPHSNQSPTSDVTGEVWYIKDVNVMCLGKIVVIDLTDRTYIYKNPDGSIGELYEWQFKILQNNIETMAESAVFGDSAKPLEYNIEQAHWTPTNCYPVYIVLHHSGTPMSNIVRLATGTEYTHTCISFNAELSPHYTFGSKKLTSNVLNPNDVGLTIMNPTDPFFKHYRCKYAVYVMYVNKRQYEAMQKCLQYFVDRKDNLRYGWFDAIFAWMGISSEKSEKYFCTKFVAKVIDAGYKIGKVPSLWMPSDFQALQNISLVNKGDDFYRYNGTITKLNEEYIKKRDFDGIKFRLREFPDELKKLIIPNYEAATVQNNPQPQLALPTAHIERKPTLESVLNSKTLDQIYLTSDWHLFKNHYKKEPNPVNTKEIIKWCQTNIKPSDVFMYLGDISFCFANQEDQIKSREIMATIPGTKVLILGNHDLMLGQVYYNACGFDYVMEEFTWKHFLFTHKPVQMITGDELNVHGHIHGSDEYKTCDGKRNVDVYPALHGNKPVTLAQLLEKKDELVTKHHYAMNYGFGEQTFAIGRLPMHEGWLKNNHTQATARIVTANLPDPPMPTVFFSRVIDPNLISNMVGVFMAPDNSKKVAIKLHFGEPGNKNLLNPKNLEVLASHYNATLVDCNTAYDGSKRLKTEEHIKTAKANGYTFAPIDILDSEKVLMLGCPGSVTLQYYKELIQQGYEKQYEYPFSAGDHLTTTLVGYNLMNYDQMIVYSHFKGHTIAGFGGAIKNIGMGLAGGRHGKTQIHGLDWSCTGHLFLERLVESASAVVDYFDKSDIVYVNVLANLSSQCDCEKNAPEPKMDDIGVLVSNDIVAIEQASFDLVRMAPNNKELMEQITNRGGTHQIEYAEWLGMGSKKYILTEYKESDESTIETPKQTTKNESASLVPIMESYIEFEQFSILNESAATDVRELVIAELDAQGKDWVGCNKFDKVDAQPNWEPLFEKVAYGDDGKPQGFVKVDALANNHNVANIQMGILKAYRSQGIAKKLCTEAIETLLMQNSNIAIFWNCNADNEGSWHLAEACGFKRVHEVTRADKSIHYVYAHPKGDGSMPVQDDYNSLYYSNLALEKERLINAFHLNENDFVHNSIKWCNYLTNLAFVVGWSSNYINGVVEAFPEASVVNLDLFVSNHQEKFESDIPVIHDFLRYDGLKYGKHISIVGDPNKGECTVFEYKLALLKDFIEFAKRYAEKGRSKHRIIIAGVWPLLFNIHPSTFEDNMVIIKDPQFNALTFSTFLKSTSDRGFARAYSNYISRYAELRTSVPLLGKRAQGYIDYFKAIPSVSLVSESWIFDQETVKYNIKAFDDNRTNLALVVGFSGGGKTTLAKELEKQYKNCEFVELDCLIQHWCFNKEQLKELSTLAYEFFYSPAGDRYRKVTEEYLKAHHTPQEEFEIPLLNDFYKFAEDYVKQHRDKKFVLEGVWPLIYKVDPARFKDWAVIIVGTSYMKSTWRSGFRDRQEPTLLGLLDSLHWKVFHRIKRFGFLLNRQLNLYRKYFTSPEIYVELKVPIQDFTISNRNRHFYSKEDLSAALEGWRSKLPTSAFGIPDERKFPLDSEKHVRSAMKLFGHASEDKKKSLARRIRSAAKKYNIDIPEGSQVHKYLHEANVMDIIPEGMKNIIFDFGSVLVNHDTRKAFLNNQNIPDEFVDELLLYANQILFYPDDFNVMLKMDKTGAEEAKKIFNDALPDHLKPYVDDVFDSFLNGIFNFDYTNRLLDTLKQKGYKLYYLSNWFQFSYEMEKSYFDTLTPKFDGGLFSWESVYMKPQSHFYQELLDKYNLNPSECIFFDDRTENLLPAEKLGIHTHRFDSKTTPILLLDMQPMELKLEEISNTLMINTPFGPELVSISDIDEWYLNSTDEFNHIMPRVECWKSLPLAIKSITGPNTPPVPNLTDYYVYVPSDVFKYKETRDPNTANLIKVGKIYIDLDSGDWYWQIQYPLERTEDNELVSGLNEFTALSGINPVVSGGRHFLMSYGDPGWKQHMAYANDYESDTGLVVNDAGFLETVYIGNLTPSVVYEFKGNLGAIDRLAEAYKNESQVDNLYSILTGRQMLVEDQIEYDENFIKINSDELYEHAVSTFATLNDQISATEYGTELLEAAYKVSEPPHFMREYNVCGDLNVYKDIDGYFFYSEMTHRRSRSVESIDLMTEAMLKSIL